MAQDKPDRKVGFIFYGESNRKRVPSGLGAGRAKSAAGGFFYEHTTCS